MPAARLPSNVVAARPAHLVYLAGEMREEEREQFLVVSGADEFSEDAAALWLLDTLRASGTCAFTVLCADNLPAACGGFREVSPGVWQSWMVGSERGWAEQWRSITKGTRWLMDHLLGTHAHRLQTSALATRRRAIAWFQRSLGLKPEGVFRNFGLRGESIAHFARIRGE